MSKNRRRRRRAIFLAVTGVVLSAAIALSVASGAAPDASVEGDALTTAPAITFTDDGAAVGNDVAARAATLAGQVPLPTGGNFNGVRWGDLHSATDDDIAFILQFNAACQWLRAIADNRDAAAAIEMWKDIPAWPAMRRSGNGAVFAAAIDQLSSTDEPHASLVLESCRESHVRETSYAAAHDLTPST